VLTIDPVRAHAFDANQAHYAAVFRDGQQDYAIPPATLTDPDRLRALAPFFFWTAWAAAAERGETGVPQGLSDADGLRY
jgi:nitric oxide reductase subunit B